MRLHFYFAGFAIGALGISGLVSACSSTNAAEEIQATDETGDVDASTKTTKKGKDSAPSTDDTGTIEEDASSGGMGEILGTLSGSCGTLKAMIDSAAPSIVDNKLVFVAGETYDRDSLSSGGQRMYDTPNAGGSSTESEVLSYEVLRYCEGATLVKTETEITYAPPDDAGVNSITDLLVSINGEKVGVSVTRAYKPPSMPLTDNDIKDLLEKKLVGINRSSVRVLAADKWVKQILHVFSVDHDATLAVERVWKSLESTLKADTIVLVTETSGGGFIYCNPDPPLGTECK